MGHRLIPARAGKTTLAHTRAYSTPAHPRAGGENCARESAIREGGGSSPRGRGKRPFGRSRISREGLIPARAGKTPYRVQHASWSRAHPRAGGENAVIEDEVHLRAGSSPRGRGKRGWGVSLSETHRLIPARAGKTPPRCHTITPASAHPRAGGENPNSTGTACGASGSSPRGRGKPRNLVSLHPGERLIPARAGKTPSSSSTSSATTAHPRAGGENTF